jgi:energy-coupling factor transporter ATP-binding protein EcfA2
MKPEFGSLFHSGVAAVLRDDSQALLRNLFEAADHSQNEWASLFSDGLYEAALGPYLSRSFAAIQNNTSDVLAVWEAKQEFSRWAAKTFGDVAKRIGWRKVFESVLAVEVPLSWELRDPHWSDSVRLTGIADMVVRVPGAAAHWCVVEFKLGYTSPEADIAQACLYHELLRHENSIATSDVSSLALVSFEPAVCERFYEAAKLHGVRGKLKDLIGELAGVVRTLSIPRGIPRPVVRKRRGLGETESGMEEVLLKTLREFNAPVERVADPVVGPTFIRFCVTPRRGIRVRSVTALGNELQVALQLDEAPIFDTGSSGITIDVQRKVREIVPFASVVNQLPKRDMRSGSSQLPVGIDLENRLVTADLAEPKHTHILVIGTTGSGKSEWLRTAIAGLILGNTPETLRLVLIDPKRSAFRDLQSSPYLLNGKVIYPDTDPVLESFEELIQEMENRYRLMEQAGVDDLRALIAMGERRARIVCICDEYGDLVKSSSRKERAAIESQFARLSAKARAAGIHLIIATQEARRETIRGAIDATLIARVALKVRSEIESRLVLGTSGAEKLLGQGDLLFKDVGTPVRLQAPCVSEEQRKEIFSDLYSL